MRPDLTSLKASSRLPAVAWIGRPEFLQIRASDFSPTTSPIHYRGAMASSTSCSVTTSFSTICTSVHCLELLASCAGSPNHRVIATLAVASPVTACIIGTEHVSQYHHDRHCGELRLRLVLKDG